MDNTFTYKDRINEVLTEYDYCLVGTKGEDTENKVYVKATTTLLILFRDLTITYGADRVSKTKGMIKVKEKANA